ncbi:hypothetical protein [Streptomyces sp. NPDC017993]|uniref:hypothetical protein n=1 Tax=Streptomyces sp. NPDC017993 TaxID=3365027 RepID=UPI003790C5F1
MSVVENGELDMAEAVRVRDHGDFGAAETRTRPLHLAEVCGLHKKTAMRYSDSERALLEQAAEQQLR